MPPTVASLSLLCSALDAEADTRLARQQVVQKYQHALEAAGYPGCIRPLHKSTWGGLRYPIRLKAEFAAHAATANDFAELGIVKAYPRLLSEYPELREKCRNQSDDFPGAVELANTMFTLPTHALVSENTRRRIVARVLG
jgi:dTDP-4-amino-4,6-dideoxygalactose transaminase